MAELLPVMMGKTKGLKAVFMKKRYRFLGSAAAILLLWNLCLGPFPPGGSAPYHWERDLEAIHGASYSGRVVSVLDEGGQRVPEDLSLVGYDNVSYAAIPRIHLTTVSQHKFQQGRIAVERLLCQIQGDRRPTADLLQPELVVRSTCAPRTQGGRTL